jgi:hypothetical protein
MGVIFEHLNLAVKFVFALASLALVAAGSVLAAIVLAVVVVINSALLTALQQWEQ